MKIAIIALILVVLATIAYFFYTAYYSPSLIGQGYDKEMEKKRIESEQRQAENETTQTTE